MARSLTQTLTDAAREAVRNDSATHGAVRLQHGRFEAQFEDLDSARAAARDARAVGFDVDVQPGTRKWLAIGRRRLPFAGDDRDRYASRFHTIATQHGGAFSRFVEEPLEGGADGE